jgi:hypothetical protein
MRGIAEWLASIGLGEYTQRFAANAIDLSVVRDLTEQDLKDLGVLLGHRRKILRAIAELDGVAPAPTETATKPAQRDEAERRHLTVMICDLVGSTALSAANSAMSKKKTSSSNTALAKNSTALPNLASDLAGLKLNLILALGTPSAKAAQQAAPTTPIIFMSGDPLGTGS